MSAIGLVDVDGHHFPNLALMKISAYHKKLGDSVEWADPMFGHYDRVYQSKVFTFTQDYPYEFDCEVLKGGTGYDITSKLPKEIDDMQPDYSIYPTLVDTRTAYGFLTRGCPNKCKWCIVPKKEGGGTSVPRHRRDCRRRTRQNYPDGQQHLGQRLRLRAA
jgi:hypothetical protein